MPLAQPVTLTWKLWFRNPRILVIDHHGLHANGVYHPYDQVTGLHIVRSAMADALGTFAENVGISIRLKDGSTIGHNHSGTGRLLPAHSIICTR